MASSQRPLAYAPTPYSYIPNPGMAATISLDEEVKLADTPAEADVYESLAELYSIIVTLDGLEKAYLRDAIHEAEYTETCSRLLKQYTSMLRDATVAAEFGGLEEFKLKWGLQCPRATERLRVGVPVTIEHPSHGHAGPVTAATTTASAASAPASALAASTVTPSAAAAPPSGGGGGGGVVTSGALILSATENFITFLDALKLNILSKDALHPLLTDVAQSVGKVTDADFENRGKIVQWLITLNRMRATEELSEEQAREIAFDIEAAYLGFKGTLD
ncbi:Vacuolar protein-sorting-associated protein 28 [Ascosphaera acerosa]|nr:Vacuolar protein-sorting-associated protein 28 [Ascosphaera acerosa]